MVRVKFSLPEELIIRILIMSKQSGINIEDILKNIITEKLEEYASEIKFPGL